GRRPGAAVGGYLAVDLAAVGVPDDDLGQLALGGPDLQRAAGLHVLGTVLGGDAHHGLGLLAAGRGGVLALRVARSGRLAGPSSAAGRDRQHHAECQCGQLSAGPSPRAHRRPRYRPHVHVVLPSAGLAGPAPPRAPRALRRIVTPGQGRWAGCEGHRSVPTSTVGGPVGTGRPGTGRGSLHRAARAPFLPVHVPAAEAVVGGDLLVLAVDHLDDVTAGAAVEEPARRGVRAAALDVAQPDAAVADVGGAEDVRVGPVVAVQEGARLGQPDGVRHVGDVVLAAEADGAAVHAGDLEHLGDDHRAVVGGGLRRPGGHRDRGEQVAVPPHLHGVPGGVDPGDLAAADGEGERPLLEAVDAGGALDVAQAEFDGDAGAGLPVVLGAEVEPGAAEPVRADVDGGAGGDADGAFHGGAVGDLPVELQGDDHAGADGGAVLRGHVADEAFFGDVGGEGGVAGRAASGAVHGDRVDGVLGGERQLVLVGPPGQSVGGDAARDRGLLGVLGL